jgi:hypothetical protein
MAFIHDLKKPDFGRSQRMGHFGDLPNILGDLFRKGLIGD